MAKVRARQCSIADMAGFFDEKLLSEDFDENVRPFVERYYSGPEPLYYKDLESLNNGASVYYMPPTWEKFDEVRATIEERLRTYTVNRGVP